LSALRRSSSEAEGEAAAGAEGARGGFCACIAGASENSRSEETAIVRKSNRFNCGILRGGMAFLLSLEQKGRDQGTKWPRDLKRTPVQF